MNKIIKDTIENDIFTKEQKIEILKRLKNEINIAEGVLTGEYKKCSQCDDYYLSKSFTTETETINARICIYEDIINSGGNEYADGYRDITYSICPKGHKKEINRRDRRK